MKRSSRQCGPTAGHNRAQGANAGEAPAFAQALSERHRERLATIGDRANGRRSGLGDSCSRRIRREHNAELPLTDHAREAALAIADGKCAAAVVPLQHDRGALTLLVGIGFAVVLVEREVSTPIEF